MSGRRIDLLTPVAADLESLLRGAQVVLEIDGAQDGELWSVMVKGHARTPGLGATEAIDRSSTSVVLGRPPSPVAGSSGDE